MSAGLAAVPALGETVLAPASAPERRPYTAGRDRRVVAIILLATWQGLSVAFGTYWIPSPWSTLSRLIAGVVSGDVPRHALYTLSEAVLGFAIGSVPAVGLPLLLRRMPTATDVLEPFMTAGYGVPKLALAPLFILWFGIGMASKVALVAVSAFFILYFSTRAGLQAVDVNLVQTARVLGATERHVTRHIIVPGAAPYILAGIRIAVPYSIGGAVIAELLSANRGLGYLVQFSATDFDTTGVFVALTVIGMIVSLANCTVTVVERRVLHWRDGLATGS